MSISEQANDILDGLAKKKAEWRTVSKEKKIKILEEISNRVTDWGIGTGWATAESVSKKIECVGEGAGIIGGYALIFPSIVHKGTSKLIEALKKDDELPKVDFKKEFQIDTSATAVVTDDDPMLKAKTLLFADGTSRCRFYREDLSSEIAVVLGAGNYSVLAVMDVLYHMFVDGRVCVLKHHPIQMPAKPYVEHVLRPLLRDGYLVSIGSDLDLAQALIYSDKVDCVHLTGGIRTHDAIVFGTENQASNKANKTPILRATMVSELGAVTPYIVVPSADPHLNEWTDKIIANHANNAFSALIANNSCTCLSTKVIVLPADHPELADKFYAAFKKLVASARLEPIWYPGTKQRYDRWLKSHEANGAHIDIYSDAPRKRVGALAADGDYLPFAVADAGTIRADDLTRPAAALFKDPSWTQEEPFAPVCTVVRVSGAAAGDYIRNAFRFADEWLWGNLSSAVFSPDSSLPLVMDAIVNGRRLRYGAVAINHPTMRGYSAAGYWGGPAGANRLEDAQSGLGTVCNMMMVDSPRHAVVLGPFEAAPVWLPPLPPAAAAVVVRVLCRGLRGLLWPFAQYPLGS